MRHAPVTLSRKQARALLDAIVYATNGTRLRPDMVAAASDLAATLAMPERAQRLRSIARQLDAERHGAQY